MRVRVYGAMFAIGCNHAIVLDEVDSGQTVQNPLEEEVDPESPGDVTYDYEGVDVLLVVDNSGSMAEEQQMLSTAVFTLVAALTDPLPDAAYPYSPAGDHLLYATSFARAVTAAQARLHERWMTEAGLGAKARQNLRDEQEVFIVHGERPDER